MVMLPLLLAPISPCFLLLSALSQRSLSNFVRVAESIIVANIVGDNGQSWENPSVTGMSRHVQSSILTLVIPSSSYRQSTNASKDGNSWLLLMMLHSSCLEMALNIFLMSNGTRDLVGSRPTYSSCDVMCDEFVNC